MIYLDNAATTLIKPKTVSQAVCYAMEHCASLGRSGHEPARQAADIAFACRSLAGTLFDTDPEHVVFTANATHGLNLAIHSLVQPGDRVVISGFEHNAVLRPLAAAGAEIVPAGRVLFRPEEALEAFASAMTPETKAVVCTHVSNVFGYVLPIEAISDLCRERQIPLIVDASQSAGVLPVSLARLHAAFIAMPGHKALYGPQGTGLLLCGIVPKPLLQGGTGSLSRLEAMPDFLPDAAEPGTHNIPGIAGLLAGLQFIAAQTTEAIRSREVHLLEALNRGLSGIPGVRTFFAGGSLQTGVLSLLLEGASCASVSQFLADRQICVRAGYHCAPLAHESAKTIKTGTIRMSLSPFLTKEDLEPVFEAIEEFKKI